MTNSRQNPCISSFKTCWCQCAYSINSEIILFQEQMVLRHHNEAESLNAVQKMDWEWSVTSDGGVYSNEHNLHIPMVHVSEDFGFDLDRG